MKTRVFMLAFALATFATGLMAQDNADQEQTGAGASQEEDREDRSVRRLGDMVGGGDSEFSMDIPTFETPVQATPQPEVSLPDPEQDAALQNLLTRRAFVPEDPDIQAELRALMADVAADARAALNAGNLDQAQRLVNVIEVFEPEQPIIAQVQNEAARRSNLANALARAAAALAEGNFVTPEGNSANDLYQQALALDPGNAAAQTGLNNTYDAILARALELAQDLDFEAAEAMLEQAGQVRDDPEAVAEARASMSDFRVRYLDDLDGQVVAAIDAGNYDEAESLITRLLALDYERDRIESLQMSLSDARLYGSLEPGQVFNDTLESSSAPGPDLVVVPAGSFMMGSPDSEADRFGNEGPRHRVTFERGFALGRTEVTVAQFEAFVNATGYRTDAEREGQSRIYDPRTGRMDSKIRITWRNDYIGEEAAPDLPVVHVSWNDAQAYVRWLSEETGRNYRLPSEAEFEYALRAGSQSPYWWGEESPEDNTENLTGDGDSSPTNASWNVAFRRYTDGFWGPAPVASLRANPFGLYDMGGNVMEWLGDCWHDSFVRAPDDGSAWVNPGCDRHVIKGGAWSSTPAMARSAFRLSSADESTDMRVGFRVARDL
ncbi:SUMF1/EgtB/PvdO family nonheme iron enzyme [Wenzhouxiangella marina]|uniref:Sulfatase-modifying factor protein n=1 Tax=Wenzhouxiangella marina TaxID=1579979 RepID=A0A0K0XVF0_9GAMM|nr:SUMF1/EgtB/PvdO family nonheme iron enzyme [Wenzhouxiangella marina]AKS41645.1 Sulfatase-modifying factor protein [Wenzhouxiangella marina]MBB6086595.1 formylglycine-generating enzyme required for sulfatase activity [Wenzhouxiangella marina]